MSTIHSVPSTPVAPAPQRSERSRPGAHSTQGGPAPGRAAAETSGVGQSFLDYAKEASSAVNRGERLLNRAMRSARRGQSLSNEELLSIQAGVCQYSMQLELASKLVDKCSNAVKQTLQAQS